MNQVSAKYLAWFLWAVIMGLTAVIILVEHYLVPSLASDSLPVDLVFVLALAALATIGTVVVSKLPGNPIGWLLLVVPFAIWSAETATIYAQYAVHIRPDSIPGGLVVGLVANALWVASLMPMAFLVLLFPGGSLLATRWRWVSWGLVGGFVLLIVSTSLRPELTFLDVQPPLRSPIAISGAI